MWDKNYLNGEESETDDEVGDPIDSDCDGGGHGTSSRVEQFGDQEPGNGTGSRSKSHDEQDDQNNTEVG